MGGRSLLVIIEGELSKVPEGVMVSKREIHGILSQYESVIVVSFRLARSVGLVICSKQIVGSLRSAFERQEEKGLRKGEISLIALISLAQSR